MKYIILFFLYCSFLSCSDIEYPERFVDLIKFPHKEIIDVEYRRINSKDELVRYFESTLPSYGTASYKLQFSSSDHHYDEYMYYKYLIYINPLSNNKPVLNKGVYDSGMPIALDDKTVTFDTVFGVGYDIQKKRYRFAESEQPIILIKGKPEWADSSHNGFTILPVCDSGDESYLDFTWSVKKQKKKI